MDTIIKLSEKTEGRDKFTKAIQYASRIISWAASDKNADLSKRFKMLFMLARDSRKIFRLFKSINEYQQLEEKIFKSLVWQPVKTPIFFDILSRLGFFFYWIFDNIQILSSIKFLNFDPNHHAKLASYGWLVGIIFGIARHIYDLLVLLNRKYFPSEFDKNINQSKLDFDILKVMIDITGKLGDLITASNGAGIPQKLFGKGFSDGLIGMGGLWASIVSLWNLYLKA